MRILGLSSFRHDSSAALLEDGKIIAAVEDAKLSRFPSRGLPESAIQFCLAKAGATWHDLDAIAVSTRPLRGWARRSWSGARTSAFSPIAAAYFEANELGGLARDLSNRNCVSVRPISAQIRSCDWSNKKKRIRTSCSRPESLVSAASTNTFRSSAKEPASEPKAS